MTTRSLNNETERHASADLAQSVRQLISENVVKHSALQGVGTAAAHFQPGKMLRTRLAQVLIAGVDGVDLDRLRRACAATELVHTASLCHDDVIDEGMVRRAMPTLWKQTTPSAAILIGDLLLCDALAILLDSGDVGLTKNMVDKVREVCCAETDQELNYRGEQLDAERCIKIARGKTGPLFAFVAGVCGGSDHEATAALEEAGYLIGTAYQIADDLLDLAGGEQAAMKTLGTDVLRRKFTLPQKETTGLALAKRAIHKLCVSAVDALRNQPHFQANLKRFISEDMQNIFNRYDLRLEIAIC